MSGSDALLQQLLPSLGPWLLVAMTWAETSFITGLVVPAGVATAMAAFLSTQGYFPLEAVVGAAGVGALAGDLTGFWVGRRFGGRLAEGRGFLTRMARRYEPRTTRLFQRHPIYAVTGARLISFVRTLMPSMAGMSPLTVLRFLAYDLLGVVGYVAMYTAIGTLAGESWRRAVQWVGTGGTLLLGAAALAVWFLSRRRKRRLAPPEPEGGAP